MIGAEISTEQFHFTGDCQVCQRHPDACDKCSHGLEKILVRNGIVDMFIRGYVEVISINWAMGSHLPIDTKCQQNEDKTDAYFNE